MFTECAPSRLRTSAQHVVVQAPVKTTFRKHFIAEKKTREYQEEGGIEVSEAIVGRSSMQGPRR